MKDIKQIIKNFTKCYNIKKLYSKKLQFTRLSCADAILKTCRI